MKYNESLEIQIDNLTVDGCGNTADGDYAVFGALPGETVQAVHLARKRKKKYLRTTEVLVASKSRVEPECEAAAFCGGCSFQHLAHEEQLTLKADFLKEVLAPLEPESWLPPLTGGAYRYRTKARLGVKFVEKKGRVLVGFREKQKPYIADISCCPILAPGLDDIIQPLEALISRLSVVKALPQIELAAGDSGAALIFRHLEPVTSEDLEKLKRFAAERQVSIYLQPAGPDSIHRIFSPVEDEFLHYGLPEFGLDFAFSPLDFTQVNLAVNQMMVRRALDLLDLNEADRVLDAFCGIGNFSLAIAKSGASVLAAEQSAACIERGKMNAARNGIKNIQFEIVDLHSESPEIPDFTGVNKVLLDPPRSGALSLVKKLASSNVERVVYVSCNPETLARDVKFLVDQGYTLRSAGIINMFPHTTHVESVALLCRETRHDGSAL